MRAVIFLDLDQFKVVNDSLGHPAGDEMLIQVGQRLLKCLRSSDTLARFGGDEFVILLESVSSRRDVVQVADRVQHALSEPFEIAGRKVFTTVSMGIVIGLKQYSNREEVLQDADIAMYRAKSAGKARYVIFDATMRKRAVNRLSLEMDLRHAIEQNHLFLVYQPIMNLDTHTLVGFEALARWQHPEHGVILPSDFIPIAEETSLIRELGKWVLREACREFAPIYFRMKPTQPLVLSVNVSSRQITENGFVENIRETLESYRLLPSCLKLEITESALIESVDIARHVFHQLRQMGVDIHVDDFGTGYSSLSYIHRLPVDLIKIDQAFIQKLGEDEQSVEITRSILQMARSLGIKTIAEGIESQQQYLFLRQMACEFGQGYFLSKPMTIHQLEDFLNSQNHSLTAE
jgi:diguanylate cyclase (GGDEF)-like protein